ncbi:hypothetical protein H112_01461 [Trichophyton rubrum D6]|nr:hypothetical protein H113_01466 [Trichophyton rubrum MR1459]KDB37232.1 hypothetical protein H112_01461 [Trichophyton rubrum D6]
MASAWPGYGGQRTSREVDLKQQYCQTNPENEDTKEITTTTKEQTGKRRWRDQQTGANQKGEVDGVVVRAVATILLDQGMTYQTRTGRPRKMHACKCVQETTSEAFSFAWELEGGLIGSKTGDPGQAKGRGIRYDKAGGGGFKSAGSMEPDLRLLLRPRPKANRIGTEGCWPGCQTSQRAG